MNVVDADVDADVDVDRVRKLSHLSCLALDSRIASACRAAFMTSQPFPLNHDPLVANVNKHFKLFNNLVLLHQLGLELFNLLLLFLFHLLEVLARLSQLPSQVRPDSIFGRWQRLGVYGRPVLRQARSHLLRIAVDGRPSIVNVPRQQVTVRVVRLENLECFRYACTYI